jgi:hypothetical protein
VDGGDGVVVSMASSSAAAASDVKVSVVEGREMCDCTRWRDVGKWPVWKVDLWRRRDPASDFGSVGVGLAGALDPYKTRKVDRWHTVRIELQDLQVHVSVRDDEVELLVKGQEFDRDGFQVVF